MRHQLDSMPIQTIIEWCPERKLAGLTAWKDTH